MNMVTIIVCVISFVITAQILVCMAVLSNCMPGQSLLLRDQDRPERAVTRLSDQVDVVGG